MTTKFCARSTPTEVARFCANGTLPPPPPPVPKGPAWAHQLPPLRANELAACAAGVTKSTDDGRTWAEPWILQVGQILL